MRREAKNRNYPDLLEQLRNDVNSSTLVEENCAGESEDSQSDEAHVSVDGHKTGFDN